jgi:hypothetical protein
MVDLWRRRDAAALSFCLLCRSLLSSVVIVSCESGLRWCCYSLGSGVSEMKFDQCNFWLGNESVR